jgi:hypothetical protein
MPEKTVQDLGDKELASDDRPIFSAVAKLVEALSLAIPMSHDLDLKAQALRLGYELATRHEVRGGKRVAGGTAGD